MSSFFHKCFHLLSGTERCLGRRRWGVPEIRRRRHKSHTFKDFEANHRREENANESFGDIFEQLIRAVFWKVSHSGILRPTCCQDAPG